MTTTRLYGEKISRRFVIITPVLNGEKYLADALASIDAQSHRDWIHYVVDGGSSDSTLEIVQRSMQAEPRRRLIQGSDRGLYDALFKGFAAAYSEGSADDDVYCWLNADDRLAPWAFATMTLAFDTDGGEWITGQPGRWDGEGRLILVEPNGWYPRRFIAGGWFNFNCLGSIQQESTFFTARILRKLSPQAVANIRGTRLAGDFLLWREFARLSALRVLPTVVGGFRLHGANLSTKSMDAYVKELRANGAVMLPSTVAKCCRLFYQIVAAIVASLKTRRPVGAAKK
ncbi:MAG TPA: glycosyltransferase [Rhizomicrobium sp.]|nr:glycosyltransferase [Rhizomicrobium sp.]